MSLFWVLKWGGRSGYGKLWTFVICPGEILTSKFHSNFNLRNKNTKKFAILRTWKEICNALYFSIYSIESLKWSVVGVSTLAANWCIIGVYFLGIIGWDPTVSKSNQWAHVEIFRLFYISFEVLSPFSSQKIHNFPEVLNLNRLFLELNQFTYNSRFSPILWSGKPAISYIWTGWVWEITGWSSRLQENYWSF